MGNDVNATDFQKKTPLHIACINNDEECVKKLLLQLADPFKKFKDKKPEEITTNNNIKYFIVRAKIVIFTND
jgi:ankyrin repeat protein